MPDLPAYRERTPCPPRTPLRDLGPFPRRAGPPVPGGRTLHRARSPRHRPAAPIRHHGQPRRIENPPPERGFALVRPRTLREHRRLPGCRFRRTRRPPSRHIAAGVPGPPSGRPRTPHTRGIPLPASLIRRAPRAGSAIPPADHPIGCTGAITSTDQREPGQNGRDRGSARDQPPEWRPLFGTPRDTGSDARRALFRMRFPDRTARPHRETSAADEPQGGAKVVHWLMPMLSTMWEVLIDVRGRAGDARRTGGRWT